MLVAIVSAGCGSLPTALDYTSGHRERVSADIPEFKITYLDVFNAPNHPGRVWVENSTRGLVMLMNGQGDQWLAILPRIEPIYRNAALAVLNKDDPGRCEISSSLPYPDQVAIEFAYVCKSKY